LFVFRFRLGMSYRFSFSFIKSADDHVFLGMWLFDARAIMSRG